MRVNDNVIVLIQRSIPVLGIIGTVIGLYNSATSWLNKAATYLLVALVILLIADVIIHSVPLTIPWRKVRKGIASIISKLNDRGFASPDVVIGIGRAGSIIGATLAANLGHRPFIALDIQHERINHARRVIINGPLDLNPERLVNKRVLLVSAYLHSGETFHAFKKHLFEKCGKEMEICHAALFVHPETNEKNGDDLFVFAFKEILDEKRWKITPWFIKSKYSYR